MKKRGNLSEFHSERNYLLQNWYFSTETRLKGKTKVVQNSLPDVEQQIQIPLRIIGQGLQRNNVKGREVGERSPVLVQNSAFIHIDLAEVFGIHNVFLEKTHKTYDYIYY